MRYLAINIMRIVSVSPLQKTCSYEIGSVDLLFLLMLLYWRYIHSLIVVSILKIVEGVNYRIFWKKNTPSISSCSACIISVL